MDRVNVLIERLGTAVFELNQKQDRVDEIERELGGLCPIRQGDIVTVDAESPHAGKQMEVLQIVFVRSKRHQTPVIHCWRAHGSVLRKDQTPSTRYGTHTEFLHSEERRASPT